MWGGAPRDARSAAPRAKRGVTGALFTGCQTCLRIPLGCVAASRTFAATQPNGLLRKEDCCDATQWDKKRKIVATQPNGMK